MWLDFKETKNIKLTISVYFPYFLAFCSAPPSHQSSASAARRPCWMAELGIPCPKGTFNLTATSMAGNTHKRVLLLLLSNASWRGFLLFPRADKTEFLNRQIRSSGNPPPLMQFVQSHGVCKPPRISPPSPKVTHLISHLCDICSESSHLFRFPMFLIIHRCGTFGPDQRTTCTIS